jgi:hypothetical protein
MSTFFIRARASERVAFLWQVMQRTSRLKRTVRPPLCHGMIWFVSHSFQSNGSVLRHLFPAQKPACSLRICLRYHGGMLRVLRFTIYRKYSCIVCRIILLICLVTNPFLESVAISRYPAVKTITSRYWSHSTGCITAVGLEITWLKSFQQWRYQSKYCAKY